MKLINQISLIFVVFIILGCGSDKKKETFGDKIDKKMNKVESDLKKLDKKVQSKAEEIDEKVKDKVDEIDKKAEKKSAPIVFSFELTGNIMMISVHLQKSVKNLEIKANPLQGLSIQKYSVPEKTTYDAPATLTFTVPLNNQIGRLAVSVSGLFEGQQYAKTSTYDFPLSGISLKPTASDVKIDGKGELIRVMPATEK